MIKPGQFKISDTDITCTQCDHTVERVAVTTDEVWGDAIQDFIEAHKISCEVN